MNNKEILEKAVAKAIANGWNTLDVTDWWKVYWMYGHERLAVEFRANQNGMGLFYEWPVIVFNQDFAKAIWGEVWPSEQHSTNQTKPAIAPWQHHLQRMVIADDPIHYLGEHLDG